MVDTKKNLKKKNRELAKKIRQTKKIKKKTTKKKSKKKVSKSHIVLKKDGSVDIPASILNVYSRGDKNPNYPIPRRIAQHAYSASKLPLTEQQEIIKFLRKEARKFKTPLPEHQPLMVPLSLLNSIVPNQHKNIIKQIASGNPISESVEQQIKTVKKWPVVQTTDPIQQIPPESFSRLQVGGKEQILQELQGLKKAEGLNDEFKQKLDNMLKG